MATISESKKSCKETQRSSMQCCFRKVGINTVMESMKSKLGLGGQRRLRLWRLELHSQIGKLCFFPHQL
ncbi:hypothetical protein VTP01DRAFT_421 [Rhizomucor pusillus]|uniref:uncharacterized protein n=1 Tax=Rhizomucor pusillus TaxID=4840 RepID=UPI003743FEB1